MSDTEQNHAPRPPAGSPGPWQEPGPFRPDPMPPRHPNAQPRRARPVSELITELDRPPAPEARGWRKWLRLGPTKAELELAADEQALRTGFVRPITIVVATPKGGAGKTPTSIGLAGAFGMARGGGVVDWDNNELRGTLQDRTYSPHRRDVVDMLRHQEWLLRGDARAADVQQGLNYQARGQFWVLGSSQEAGRQITRENFDVVHEILARFFPVIIIDTGNNEVASNWLAAVHSADCLVVPVKWRKDNLIPAARMIETLTKQDHDVVDRLVIVGTNGPTDAVASIQGTAVQWFQDRPILEVPTDQHIAEGAEISWDKLAPETRRAYQRLGATVARVVAERLGVAS